MSARIIPRLDIKGPNLVKGIHLEGLRVLGAPEQFARYYYETGADELLYIDIVASLYQRNSLHHIIEKTARDIFLPITVGGGLRSIADIKSVLRSGADKVALNTAVVQRPELIREASEKFGSSTIVISIEAKKKPDGAYECYTDNGRVKTGLDPIEWAQKAAGLGAGEILLTSIDMEGTGKGYDCDLTRRIATSVPIPVIACGGAGSAGDVLDVITRGRADAVSLASMIHYHFLKSYDCQLETFKEGNLNFLRSKEGYSKVNGISLEDLKEYLSKNGIGRRTVSSVTGV